MESAFPAVLRFPWNGPLTSDPAPKTLFVLHVADQTAVLRGLRDVNKALQKIQSGAKRTAGEKGKREHEDDDASAVTESSLLLLIRA